MKSLLSRTAKIVSLIAGLAIAQSISAQAIRLDRPDVAALDENKVSLTAGKPAFSVEAVSIGADSRLRFVVTDVPERYGHNVFHNFAGGVRYASYPTRTDVVSYEVHTGEAGEMFYLIGGQFVSYTGQGSTLTDTGSGFRYVRFDGAEFNFSKNIKASFRAGLASIVQSKFPNGYQIDFYYSGNSLMSVVDNRGYQLKFSHRVVTGPPYYLDGIQKVTAINNAVEYCDVYVDSCSLANVWPTATFTLGTLPAMPEHEGNLSTLSILDSVGLTTRFTFDSYNQLVRVKESTSLVDNIVYSYCRYNSPYNCYVSEAGGNTTIVSGLLVGATNAGRSWVYDFHSSPNTGNYFGTSTSSGPYGQYVTRVRINARPGPLLSTQDASGNAASFEESDRNFPTSISQKGGKSYSFEYDTRGNVKTKTQLSADTSKVPHAVLVGSYDVVCNNIKTCNKPNYIIDANTNRYDYTYDAMHGQMLSETLPPNTDGVRPQTRYTYSQRYSWVKNSAGAFVRSNSPIWLLVGASTCRVGAASSSGVGCALGNADEIATAFDYGPDSGPNNLSLRGVVITATDGGIVTSLRTCYGYDKLGNKSGTTLPKAALQSCP